MFPHSADVSFISNVHPSISVELESILQKWPKVNHCTRKRLSLLNYFMFYQVKTLSIQGIMSEFVRPLCNPFGATLTKLGFYNCAALDLSQIASCTLLEDWEIIACSIHSIGHSKWNAVTFLPLLKKLETYHACLGPYWAPICEKKTSFVHINLNCIHIGTNV